MKKLKFLPLLMAFALVIIGTQPVNAAFNEHNIVIFDFNDGSGRMHKASYFVGDKITNVPEVKDTDTKKFLGWATGYDGDRPTYWDFENDVMPDYNMVLWAIYGDLYEVSFLSDDGIYNVKYLEGDRITNVPEVKDTDTKRFLGWATGYNGDDPIYWDFENDVMPDYDIALWAVYENLYKVVFELNDGTNKYHEESYAAGELITKPANPTNGDKIFKGWFTEAGIEWDFASHTVEDDLTLYAKWDKETVDPTNPKEPGETVDPTNPKEPGETVDPTNPKEPGYTLPQTGIKQNNQYIALGLLSGGLVLIISSILRKRKSTHI